MIPPELRGTSGKIVKVGPGEHHVTTDPEVRIVTVLGSCVAACIRDPQAGVGGLNHFMLPDSAKGAWDDMPGSLRYGNFAMDRLIDDILRRGGRRDRLEIKLFGAAWMGPERNSVGTRNALFAKAYLRENRLNMLCGDLGGTRARRIVYEALSGKVFMLELQDHPLRFDAALTTSQDVEPRCPSRS